MPELTDAEKRQLLRERRAAKMAKSSHTRMNKIIGTSGSDVHEPIVAPISSATTTSSNQTESNITSKKSTITETSCDFVQADDEPPVPSIDDLNNDPLHGDLDVSMDDIIKRVLQSHQQSASAHSDDSNNPLPDNFMETIGSLMGNMGSSSDNGLSSAPNTAEGSEVVNGISLEVRTHYKNIFALIRYFFVTLVFFYSCVGNNQCFAFTSPNSLFKSKSLFAFNWLKYNYTPAISSGCNLWTLFVTMQCIFAAISLYFASCGFFPHRAKDSWIGIVVNLVPGQYKSYLTVAVGYFDVVLGFWRDICLLLVLLVLKTVLS